MPQKKSAAVIGKVGDLAEPGALGPGERSLDSLSAVQLARSEHGRVRHAKKQLDVWAVGGVGRQVRRRARHLSRVGERGRGDLG
jgi:hypothetical protein